MGVTGNLRMLKDDVIQLSIVGFGIMEVGRLEFTRDYVMVIDRINKQFVKVPYAEVDFLAAAEVDFFTFQALFWNELTLPSASHVATSQAGEFAVTQQETQTLLTAQTEGLLSYRFFTQPETAHLVRTEIGTGSTRLCCDYQTFSAFHEQSFPTTITLSVEGTKKAIALDMRLSSMSDATDWETRTALSSKYKEVSPTDLLAKMMKQ